MGLLTRRQFIGAACSLSVVSQGLVLPAVGLTINPRSSWATNRPPKGPLGSEDVKFLLVHHSASRNGHTGADAPGILRSFYDFHTGPEKGWNDIAYNFCIDADGGVWEARSGSIKGAIAGDATGGNQGFSQLVCIIGDYNAANPSQASLNSLVSLLAWLADKSGVSTAEGSQVSFTSRGSNKSPAGSSVTTPTITGHRTMSQTTCPGDNLFSYVAGGLMADVDAARGGASPPASSTTTAAPSTTVASSTTTTTVPPTTTTVTPTTSTTSTLPSTTSAAPVTTSTVLPPTTDPTPTTLQIAADKLVGGTSQSPLLIISGGLVAVGAGLVLWRSRRMNG